MKGASRARMAKAAPSTTALSSALREIERSHQAEQAARQAAADATAARALEAEATAAAEAELAQQRREVQRQLRAADAARRSVTLRSAVDGALLREALAEAEDECSRVHAELRKVQRSSLDAAQRSSFDAAQRNETRAAVRAQCDRVIELASAAVIAASPSDQRPALQSGRSPPRRTAVDGVGFASPAAAWPPYSAAAEYDEEPAPARAPTEAWLNSLMTRHEAAHDERLSEVHARMAPECTRPRLDKHSLESP